MDSDSAARAFAMEEDGCSTALFQYLWMKNEGLGFKATIADTLVYRQRILDAWYFTCGTGPDKGTVKKRGAAYLHNDAIENFFLDRSADEFDVIATLVVLREDEDGKVDPTAGATCEYLTAATLHDFLLLRRKPLSGIIQRFILPKGGYNCVLRALWSPYHFLLDRRTTIAPLYDSRIPVLDRVVTFDGPSHLSTEETAHGEILPRTVQSLCDALVSHVYSVTHSNATINRMVLLLKVGNDGKLSVMYASSIRLDSAGALERSATLRAAMATAATESVSSLVSSVVAGHGSRRSVAASASSSRSTALSLSAVLHSPTQIEASSRRGFIRLDSDPVARSGPGGGSSFSPPVRHATVERIAAEATATSTNSRHGMTYLSRKSDILAPPDQHDHCIPSPAGAQQCPSCGRQKHAASGLFVANILVVKHYEAICRFFHVEPYMESGASAMMSGGAIDLDALRILSPKPNNHWPSAAAVVGVTDGVGMYGAFPPETLDVGDVAGSAMGDASSIGLGRSRTAVVVRAEPTDAGGRPKRMLVTEVPPTLLVADPRFRASTYRSLRSDPMWLSKPLSICDACYVAFTALQSGRDDNLTLRDSASPGARREINKLNPEREADSRHLASQSGGSTVTANFADHSHRASSTDEDTHRVLEPRTPSSSLLSPLRQTFGGRGDQSMMQSEPQSSHSEEPELPADWAADLSGVSPQIKKLFVAKVEAASKAVSKSGKSPRSKKIGLGPSIDGLADLHAPDDEPTYTKADAWHLHSLPPQPKESGVLAVGVATFGKRQYFGMVRFAQGWETLGIRMQLSPPPPKVITAEPDDEASAPWDFDSLPFAVYMRSLRSARTSAIYIMGWQLRTSMNPLLRKAAGKLRLVPPAEVDNVYGNILPADLDHSNVVMYGLYSLAGERDRDPKAIDFCVLVTSSASEKGKHDDGRMTFHLRALRLGSGSLVTLSASNFAQLYEQMTELGLEHPLILYAAKARLVSSLMRVKDSEERRRLLSMAGGTQHGNTGGRKELLQSGEAGRLLEVSVPVAGTVLRLVPGHFLGGMASLDRYRGFVADPTSLAAKSAAGQLLRKQLAEDGGISHSKHKCGARGLDNHQPILALGPQGMPVDIVAETLETMVDLPKAMALEIGFVKSCAELAVGVVARGLFVSPSGTNLMCSLAFAFPLDRTALPQPDSEKIQKLSTTLTHTWEGPGLLLKAHRLDDGTPTCSSFVRPKDIQRPILGHRDACSLDASTPVSIDFAPPGNPFVQDLALDALTDVHGGIDETLLAARVVPGSYCQRFVVTHDAGSLTNARKDRFALHSTVHEGGNYVLSLSMTRAVPEGQQGSRVVPIGVDIGSTRVRADVDANSDKILLSREAELPAGDHGNVSALRFVLRCQYLRDPLPSFEPAVTHDSAVERTANILNRALKTSHMLAVEMESWVLDGRLPTSATLIQLANDRDRAVAAEAASRASPSVRSCQVAVVEPMHTFVMTLDEARRPDLNPFLDLFGSDSLARRVRP